MPRPVAANFHEISETANSRREERSEGRKLVEGSKFALTAELDGRRRLGRTCWWIGLQTPESRAGLVR